MGVSKRTQKGEIMETIRILLCCGAGMSSGFLANAARKAAKKKKLDVNIEARSHSDIASYMSSIDVLMVGPHYAGELPEFKKMADPYNVCVCVIPKDIYAMLNGEALLDYAIKTIEEK
ncbi:PTS sugar transporter subunit IIB [Amedibacillus sp. YH-ame6]